MAVGQNLNSPKPAHVTYKNTWLFRWSEDNENKNHKYISLLRKVNHDFAQLKLCSFRNATNLLHVEPIILDIYQIKILRTCAL